MDEKINIQNILFLDIETVPVVPLYDDLDEQYQKLWEKKSRFFRKEDETPDEAFERAGIYSEFGKIICISIGLVFEKNGEKFFRTKSFSGHNEIDVLKGFNELVEKKFSGDNHYLCAHNGREFDFPYIARRSMIHGLKIPRHIFNASTKRPWDKDYRLLDTMEMWKFGDYKNYTSLELLARLFDIPTPKDDIDGSMVAEVYYADNDLERIVTYCEKDVLTIAQLYLKYNYMDTIKPENIEKS